MADRLPTVSSRTPAEGENLCYPMHLDEGMDHFVPSDGELEFIAPMPRLRDDDPFQHPALLAKDIATIDRLSGGRVELGIGAGWDFSGHYSSVKGLEALPRCSQQPRPFSSVSLVHECSTSPACPPTSWACQSRMGAGHIGRDAVADLAAPSLDGKIARVRQAAACAGRPAPGCSSASFTWTSPMSPRARRIARRGQTPLRIKWIRWKVRPLQSSAPQPNAPTKSASTAIDSASTTGTSARTPKPRAPSSRISPRRMGAEACNSKLLPVSNLRRIGHHDCARWSQARDKGSQLGRQPVHVVLGGP